MRILVTNDDGIHSTGLNVAEYIAQSLTKDKSDVFVVAPAFEQSGSGHGLKSYREPVTLEQVSRNRFKLNGTPADCVLAGLFFVLKDKKPDLILSGVNRGHNISRSVLYSGTIGAAIEGSLHNIKSIALSQSYSDKSVKSDDMYKWSKYNGASICKRLLNMSEWHDKVGNIFFNVNFPISDVSDGQKVKVCGIESQSTNPFFLRRKDQISCSSRIELQAIYSPSSLSKEHPLGDKTFLSRGYTTITPMNTNMTDYPMMESVEEMISIEK